MRQRRERARVAVVVVVVAQEEQGHPRQTIERDARLADAARRWEIMRRGFAEDLQECCRGRTHMCCRIRVDRSR